MPRSRGAASRSSRATTSAVRLATEPPLTKSPPAPSGRPQRRRSQSTTTSSTCAGPGPSSQVPQNGLRPAARASATTPTKLLGLGTKAKKRGWPMCPWKGATSRSKRARTANGSAGPSGGGSSSRAASGARGVCRVTGSSRSPAQRATSRSIAR